MEPKTKKIYWGGSVQPKPLYPPSSSHSSRPSLISTKFLNAPTRPSSEKVRSNPFTEPSSSTSMLYPTTKKVSVKLNESKETISSSEKRRRDSDSVESVDLAAKSRNRGTWSEASLTAADYADPTELIVSILMRESPTSHDRILRIMREKTKHTWTEKYCSKYGSLMQFVKRHPDIFVMSSDGINISLYSDFNSTSGPDTSPPEPMRSDGVMRSQFAELVCVGRDDGGYGGWKRELFVEMLTATETNFLLCHYCGGVLRDACLFTKAGKQELACSFCIPNNINKQTAQINRDTIIEKKVSCPIKGCAWKKELRWLLHHLEECGLFPVPCPLGCKDERGDVCKVGRKDVAAHEACCPMRTVQCDNCESIMKHCMMNTHLNICKNVYITCPNGCNGAKAMERKNMSIHLTQDCPLQVIDCPFSQSGCRVEVQRREMALHAERDVQAHLRLLMLNNVKMQKRISRLEKELSVKKRGGASLFKKKAIRKAE